MHLSTLACFLAASAATVAGQNGPNGIINPSTTENCTEYQDYPDPIYPEQGNTCASISAYWFIEEQDFIKWNPAVGPTCGNLVGGNSYCIYADDYDYSGELGTFCYYDDPNCSTSGEDDHTSDYDSDDSSSDGDDHTFSDGVSDPEDSDSAYSFVDPDALDGENGSPITPEDCTRAGPGQEDCATTAYLWSITEEDFIALNPSVGSDCSNITQGKIYCTQARTHPLLDSSATSECDHHVTYPDLFSPDIAASEGNTCKSFANTWFIKESDFKAWNPVVGKDCENFEEGKRYCVWVEGAQEYYNYLLGNETTTMTTMGGATATTSMSASASVPTTGSATSSAMPSTTASPAEGDSAGLRVRGSAVYLILAIGNLGYLFSV